MKNQNCHDGFIVIYFFALGWLKHHRRHTAFVCLACNKQSLVAENIHGFLDINNKHVRAFESKFLLPSTLANRDSQTVGGVVVN